MSGAPVCFSLAAIEFFPQSTLTGYSTVPVKDYLSLEAFKAVTDWHKLFPPPLGTVGKSFHGYTLSYWATPSEVQLVVFSSERIIRLPPF
jgi:hypothetical protein